MLENAVESHTSGAYFVGQLFCLSLYCLFQQPFVQFRGIDLFSFDVVRIIREKVTGDDPVNLGKELAQKALAQGAYEILRGVKNDHQR